MTPTTRRTFGVLRRGCVRRPAVALAATCVLSACFDAPPPSSQQRLAVVLDTSRGVGAASLVLKARLASQLREWSGKPRSVFTVSVAGVDSVAVAGTYATNDTALEFRPAHPLDVGRAYTVSIGSSRRRDTLMIPARTGGVATRVLRVYPSANAVPENLRRLHIEFSAPMSRDGAIGFVHLLDDTGGEVQRAFLPGDGDVWNTDHTRYTLVLDPGRMLPSERTGRPLTSGKGYTLRVDSAWRDARGATLATSFDHALHVAPADLQPVRLADWRVGSPGARTVEQLVVRFSKPLDHGLLHRALGVETLGGRRLNGTVEVDAGERVWRFSPSEPWRAGEFRVVVLSILEDVAGNRIDRQFEADRIDRVDSAAVQPRFFLPFSIR